MPSDYLRILFLCHYYPPEIGGGATRFDWLTRHLSLRGHQVHVLTGMPNYPNGLIAPGYRGKRHLVENVNSIEVERTWIFPAAYDSRWRRLANYLSYVISAILTGISARKDYDVIIATSPPLFVAIAGWLLARFHRIPWVFDIGDLWPEVAMEAGEMKPGSLVACGMGALARWLYQDAARLTPVTDAKRLRLIAIGVPEEKIAVVENGVDLAQTETIAIPWRDQLQLGEKLIILYAGLIGIAQGVEMVLEAASLLRDQPAIQFLIVGEGVRRAALVEQARVLELENITFLDAQPRKYIPSLLEAADVIWIPLANDQLQDAVPSKLMEAWGFGKPVILSAAGEAARLVEAAQGGCVVPPGQVDIFVKRIRQSGADPEWRRRCGEKGRRYAYTHFDCRLLVERMDNLLNQVVAEAKTRR